MVQFPVWSPGELKTKAQPIDQKNHGTIRWLLCSALHILSCSLPCSNNMRDILLVARKIPLMKIIVKVDFRDTAFQSLLPQSWPYVSSITSLIDPRRSYQSI